jgi:hypothetical protein
LVLVKGITKYSELPPISPKDPKDPIDLSIDKILSFSWFHDWFIVFIVFIDVAAEGSFIYQVLIELVKLWV